MRSALRKMGNSTGLIVPRTVLAELGLSTGSTMDIRVEDGRIVVVPVTSEARAGWAAAAVSVADGPVDTEWLGFGNQGDADLVW